MRRALLFSSLFVATVAAVACASIYGVTDVPTPVDAGGPDVSSDRSPPADAGDGAVAPDSGSDGSSSCPPNAWPDPPSADGGDGSTVSDIVLAAKTVDLDPTHAIGLNLDHVCTCPGPESCKTPAGAPAADSCDNPLGVDPSLNRVLRDFGLLYCIPFVKAVEKGYSNILLRIRGYNGAADDDQVAVELFVSVGTVPVNDAGTPTPPRYDGTDVWQLDQDGINGMPPNEVSNYVDLQAYVTNHVLVARPQDLNGKTALLWRLAPSLCSGGTNIVGPLPLVFEGTGVVLTGTLSQDASGSWSLQNGLAGARVATDGTTGLLAALQLFGLCPDGGAYQGAVDFICPARDITHALGLDNTGAGCDSVSFALGFTATQAQLGPAVPVPLGSLCGGPAPTCN